MCRFLKALAVALLLLGVTTEAQQTRVQPAIQTATLSVWNSGTSLNATQSIFAPGDAGFDAVLVHLVQSSGSFSAGAITFETSYDNSNWVTVPADAVHDPSSTTWATISLPYTLVTSTNKPFLIHTKGWQALRIKLSTAITGTGTVTPNVTWLADTPVGDVIALSPTAANFLVTATLGAGSALAGEVTPAASATTADMLSTSYTAAAASTNATNVKNGAGNVYGYSVSNTNTTVYYLRMYNLSTSPTCSSSTGFVETIPVPPAAASGNVGGRERWHPLGQAFATGIGFCITGGSGNTDNTNAATGVFVTILYK